jgi:L-iditol 2-dehydrogenase
VKVRAAFLVASQRYEVREIPVPACPEDGLILKVEACGICGSDLRRWKEGPPPGIVDMVSGHEIAGVVVQVGDKVTSLTESERLAIAPDVHCGNCYYCRQGFFNLCDNLRLIGITPGYQGGFAEYLVITAEILQGGIVHKIPPSLTPLQAALAEPLSSVLASQEVANVSSGNTVVVMGAGPIGCMHIAIARAKGARVILSEPSEIRRQLATRFEPEVIVDPTKQDLVAGVRRLTDGLGADVAICANPIAATHTQAVELVRKRGQVILFGGLPKDHPMTSLDGNRIHYNEVRIMGTFSYHPRFHAQALEAIQSKLVNPEQLITHVYPIEKINEAFQMAVSGEALKVVIQMDSPYELSGTPKPNEG